MKKTFLSTVFVAVIALFLFSCGQERVDESTADLIAGKETQEFSRKKREKDVSVFVNDELMQKLIKNSSDFTKLNKKKDVKSMIALSNEIKDISNQLFKKYGEEVFFINLDYLIANESHLQKLDGSHDNDPCTRNLDGSLYYGQCSTWENIKVSIEIAFGCYRPSGQEIMLDDTLLENYYNCAQSKICNTCD